MSSPGTRVPPLLVIAAGCTPAPLLWRTLALLLDGILVTILIVLVLSRLVWPIEIPDALDIFNRQFQLILAASQQAAAGKPIPEIQLDPDYLNALAITIQTIFLVTLAYFGGSELGMRGATLGKRIFHLRAAQYGTGAPPRAVEILVRSIIKTASLAAWLAINLFGLPFLLLNAGPIFFNRTRRAGHDLMGRTIVTGDPLPPPPAEQPAHFDEE